MFRLLLLFYPRQFRRRFGNEMALAFRDGWRNARTRGFTSAIVYLAACAADSIANGLRERRVHQPCLPEPKGNSMLTNLKQDIRFAARMLRRQPGFALVAVLTLALGIGATTAIFSVVDGVLLRPLPYRDAGQLAFSWTKLPWIGVLRAWMNGRHISILQDETTQFESFAGMQAFNTQLTGDGEPQQIRVGMATPNVFDVLGTPAQIGRTFRPEDGKTGSENVAVLGNAIWRRQFGADPAVVGRKITLGGRSVEIVGVMPARFRFLIHSSLGEPSEPELWMPATWVFREMPDDGYSYALLLRMKPGVTLPQAQSDVDRIGARLDRERFKNLGFGWQLVGVRDDLTRRSRPALLMLLGAAGMVLLIVCANVGSLFLVRATGRSREFAVRTALGAGRRRIVSQLLAESLMLAGLGAALGYGLAFAGVRALAALPNLAVPRLYDVAVDGRVLAFTLLTALVAGVVFGLAPALQSSRPNLGESLKEGARGSGGARGHRLRAAFVAGEIALALVLLLGSTLFLRTFAALRGVDPGFDPKGVLTARLQLPGARYPRGQGGAEFVERVLGRIQALPGVRAAGATNATPLSKSTNQNGTQPEGSAPDLSLLVDAIQVTPGYFSALGIRILSGRDFNWQDNAKSDQILIVDDVYARAAWPNQDPVGKYVNYRGRRRVVAVVRQPRLYEVQRDDRPQIFVPYSQQFNLGVSLVVRAHDPARLAAAVRQAVWSEDRTQPVATVRLMEDIVGDSLSDRRLSMVLLAAFAAVALLLATIGIYGVVSHATGQRTQEIGIRMALGAEQSAIRSMIVRQSMRLAAVGIVLGLAGAFAFSRVLETQLYAVSAHDPLMFGGAALALIVAALASSYVPALRASRIEPAVALRRE